MKTTRNILITSLMTGLIAQAGFGQLITDTYWGGDPTNSSYNQDVIEQAGGTVFDLTGAEVFLDPGKTSMEVRIYGRYFDNILSRQGLLNTAMGDLFISTNGLANSLTGAASLDDHVGSGIETTWEYGVRLGQYLDTDASDLGAKNVKSGSVRQITDSNQIKLSYANSGYIYRANQEVQILDTAPPVANSSATWYIDTTPDGDSMDFLSMTFGGLDFGSYEKLGFHWTMTCANDVLEFEFLIPNDSNVVPEPSTIGLLSMAGLAGMLYLRRRLQRKA